MRLRSAVSPTLNRLIKSRDWPLLGKYERKGGRLGPKGAGRQMGDAL